MEIRLRVLQFSFTQLSYACHNLTEHCRHFRNKMRRNLAYVFDFFFFWENYAPNR